MSRHLRPAIRLLVAVLATTVALGPGLASLVDAKPAARAVTQRFTSHAEETGRQHELRAHVDDCTLCQLATRGASERPATPRPALAVAPAPLGDRDIPLPHSPDERWSAFSRGPPTA
jgi:hypothetical protein